MKSLYAKIGGLILMAGLLSACGGQATQAPASQPTGAAAPVNEAPANPSGSSAVSTATKSSTTVQGATVSFAKDILPILQSRCENCHGGTRTEKGLNVTTYQNLISGSENGPVVTAGNAADSSLVDMIVTQKMPKRGPKLTPDQVQLITNWVNQGALNN